MVARFSSGSNPKGAVYYNENKVEQGEAKRLALRNYAGLISDPEDASKQQVSYLLEEQCLLNTRISKPTFHASLSLAPGEKPDADELLCLADAYMIGMGYGQQPYAVYQHFDTDHTHVHIVSVRIDHEGKAISDRFEKERSNKLRQQLEKDFGLKEAEKVGRKQGLPDLKPVEYGTGDLKQQINNVVLTTLDFRFSSFAQFNQLLGLYNVKAVEVPLEGKKPGLLYTIAGEEGSRESVSFKASSLRQQPTMATIERRIKSGKKIKEDGAAQMRRLIKARLESSGSWVEFQRKLSAINIVALPHQGKDGNLFGVSFIDARQKAIYSGSELGKEYSAGALKKSLGESFEALPPQTVKEVKEQQKQTVDLPQPTPDERQTDSNTHLLRRLLQAAIGADSDNESEQDLKKMTKKSLKQ